MKKVLLVAPVMSRSGYGEMGRFALRSMLNNPNLDVYLHNIRWGHTGWIWEDDQERKMIDSLLQKTIMYQHNGAGQFDMSVQCTIPNEWKKITPFDIGYTAGIETDKVAPLWLQKGNEMDKIVVISNHSKKVYKDTSYGATNQETGETIEDYRCTTPIDVVGFPNRNLEAEEMELELKHDFNFLCVAQLSPRKNVDAVINNFIEEFRNEDVGLLLKLNGANDSVMDYHRCAQMFKEMSDTSKKEGWSCSIKLLHGNLTDAQMQGVYQHPKVKAAVSLTHGEGFGLPLFEASSNGLPVIATDWSGHLDFLTLKGNKRSKNKKFAAVKYILNPIPKNAVWEGVLPADSKWAVPNNKDARKKMRDVYKNYSKWKKNAKALATSYKDAGYMYDKFCEAIGANDHETEVNAEEGIKLL